MKDLNNNMLDELPSLILKKHFISYIVSKSKINRIHIKSVVDLIIKELNKDLINGDEIMIHNFSKISLLKTKQKNFFDMFIQKVRLSYGSKFVKFELSTKFKKNLIKFVDINSLLKKINIEEKVDDK